jgi:hypothetical protein
MTHATTSSRDVRLTREGGLALYRQMLLIRRVLLVVALELLEQWLLPWHGSQRTEVSATL